MAERAALIGFGLLGSAVGERLARAGYGLCVYDRQPAAREAAARAGFAARATAADAASGCNRLITCLTDGPTVRAVLLEEGVAAAMERGGVVIDLTTCLPEESRTLAGDLAAREITLLDAPVSGSSEAVRRGEGVLMVGGPAGVVEGCRGQLETIAPKVCHVGPSGAGSTAKLVSNLVLGLNRLALAEGLVLAERAGLDTSATLELLRAGAAYSRAMDAKGDRMVLSRYEPAARLRQHLKDVDLILRLAEQNAAAVPVSRLHRELLLRAIELGWAEQDNAAIVEVFRGRSRDDG